MIKRLTTTVGHGDVFSIAQDCALALADAFSAHITAVSSAKAHDSTPMGGAADTAETEAGKVVQQVGREFVAGAEARGLRAETSFHGEGFVQGLLQEARASDLVVVGAPVRSEQGKEEDGLGIDTCLKLIRQAECSVLVTSRPWTPVGRILLAYGGGMEGHAALRMAGAFAEKLDSEVWVLGLGNTTEDRAENVALAGKYLSGFDIEKTETSNLFKFGTSANDINTIVQQKDMDLIVLGAKPIGLLQHFFHETTAESLAVAVRAPLLVAR